MVSNIGHITNTGPSPAALGALDDVVVTQDVYMGLGEKLRALGFNTVFAPDLDVNVEAQNPVIGTRAFGSRPGQVIKHGIAAMKGLQESGIACCVKHFPGHGATSLDSHLTLPVVEDNRNTLGERELEPFRHAVGLENLPDMVMTAHVAYPAWDGSGAPATLSKPIVEGILRREMQYNNIVITDSMEMQGITERWGPEKAAVEAIQAGVDILLYAMDPKMAGAAYGAVKKAVEGGKISRDQLKTSVDRIFKLRQSFQSMDWYTDEEAKEILEFKHDQVFFEAALSGLSLEGNAGVLSEIPRTTGPKVIVLPRELDQWRRLRLDVVREQLEPAGFTIVEVGSKPTPDEIGMVEGQAAAASVVVVGVASRGKMAEENERLVAALTRRDVIKVGVALLDPGDADAMMTANCRIKTFGFAVPQLWAMCQKLMG
jgi:beta-N-acetylhexosaminidase